MPESAELLAGEATSTGECIVIPRAQLDEQAPTESQES